MSPLRILVLLPFAPTLDATHGGGRSTARLISGLAERHRVVALCLRRDGDPPADERLRSQCELLEEFRQRPTAGTAAALTARRARLSAALLRGRPMWVADSDVSALRARLGALAREWKPDVVQAEFHVMAQYLDAVPAGVVRVVTEHEIGTDAAADLSGRHRGPTSLLFRLDAVAWKGYERRVLNRADAAVVFSRIDSERLAALFNVTRIAIVPLGTNVPGSPLDPGGTEAAAIVFVGNYMHPPNVEAALVLMRHIFPRVRAQRPDAKLYVVGASATRAMQQSAGEGVVVTGAVADVNVYLDRAAAVCVPVRSGGGVRVKVLDALAAGKAVVASRRAVIGVDVRDRGDVLLAETDDEFAARLLEVIQDDLLRVRLAAGARALAERTFGWERTIAAYEALYHELLRGRRAPALHDHREK